MPRFSQIDDRSCRLTARWLWLIAMVPVLSASCAPRATGPDWAGLNPIEVLERSPRVYHVRFEDFADSIATRRALSYLGTSDGADFGTTPVDTLEIGTVTDRDRAMVEYQKALRRFEGGAGPASLMHTRKALELDPSHKPSYVLLGKLLLEQGRVSDALGLFRRIVSWDAADSEALVGLARCYMFEGKLDSARQALVDAVIYDRTSLDAWKNLHMLGEVQKFTVADHDVEELGYVREDRGRHYDIVIESSLEECPSQATAWIVFASQRAVWRYEGKFKRTQGLTRYRRTYQEDVDCFMALAAAWKILSQADSLQCESGYLDYMSRVAEEGYLVPHVLFDYVCLETPWAARNFRSEVIDEMRSYIDSYILVMGG